MTVEHTLYLDNGTKSQLNDVGGAINLTASDVVLSQSGAGSFTNRGTLSVGAGRIFAISGGTFLNDVAGTLARVRDHQLLRPRHHQCRNHQPRGVARQAELHGKGGPILDRPQFASN